MTRFFHEVPSGDSLIINGPDAQHIRRALRMQPGEHLTVCDGQGTDYACQITAFEGEGVRLSVLSQAPSCTEPSLAVTLYQGLPKGDKMDWILQKAVELGVTAVVPLATSRSVVRLDGKEEKKRERWQRIAAEAAGQCGRGIVPRVESPLSFAQALPLLRKDKTICFYEGGGQPLSRLVDAGEARLSIVIGPEGGFAEEEIAALRSAGAAVATLGPRILRCETAPLAALTLLMHLTGNLDA